MAILSFPLQGNMICDWFGRILSYSSEILHVNVRYGAAAKDDLLRSSFSKFQFSPMIVH